MNYWSESYGASTDKFRRLASANGAFLHKFTHPSETGPDGSPLTIDVARFGEQNAKHVFINTNGVHGWESYPGAAAQLELIDSGKLNTLPSGCSVVLVHCLNPFGWVYGSQRNENGVDLNRNFVDFTQLPIENSAVDLIEEAIAIDEMSLAALVKASDRLMELGRRAATADIGDALLAGQFQSPESLKFGGTSPQWGNETFREIVRTATENAETVIFLDWHTGLGDFGSYYPIPCMGVGQPGWDQTVRVWGEQVQTHAHQDIKGGDFGGDVMGDALNGLVSTAIRDEAVGATLSGGLIEFGTAPFQEIVQATILDHWMWKKVKDSSPELEFWRTILKTLFAPRHAGWERNTQTIARETYERTLQELARLA
nr:DUF2817 domain-containing protein [Hyphomonas sp. Mor2]